MHAIPRKLVLLSVIFSPMMLVGSDNLQYTDSVAPGASAQALPHLVDLQLLASAFK